MAHDYQLGPLHQRRSSLNGV